MSNTLSRSLGSSRASASDGPPHPPSFKKILIGETVFPLKYSAICCVAEVVTSTILILLYILKILILYELYQTRRNLCLLLRFRCKLITETGFVNQYYVSAAIFRAYNT